MKRRPAALVAATLLLAVAGCSGGSSKGSGSAAAPADPSKVTGDITVLTHKTDLAGNGTLDKYAAEFNKIYPNVHVKFEAIQFIPEILSRLLQAFRRAGCVALLA